MCWSTHNKQNKGIIGLHPHLISAAEKNCVCVSSGKCGSVMTDVMVFRCP